MNITHANIKAIALLVEANTPMYKLQEFIKLVNSVERTNQQSKTAAMTASGSSVRGYLASCERADQYALEKLNEIYTEYGVDTLIENKG